MFFDTILGGAMNLGLGAINNYWAEQQQATARRENYMYGEMSANQADKRTRALYNDFYSPQALMNQYREAGLSPGMMFGGTPGQGGQSGAQGSGAAGLGAIYQPLSMIESAQIAKTIAETQNIKADTSNKEIMNEGLSIDNAIKNIQRDYNNMVNEKFYNELKVLNYTIQYDDGKQETLGEIARTCDTFDDFQKKINNATNNIDEDSGDAIYKQLIKSEIGVATLRSIYKAEHTLQNEIKLLQFQTEGAETDKDIKEQNKKLVEFQNSVNDALKAAGYPNMNAGAIIATLKATEAQAELTEQQKNAFNNLIAKLGDGDLKDIIIVLSLILGQSFLKK